MRGYLSNHRRIKLVGETMPIQRFVDGRLEIPRHGLGGRVMDFIDKILKCLDCGNDFVFTAGEQLFFHDKQFKNDPKRCKQCKIKRVAGTGNGVRTETRTVCSECATETTVPFKPTQGRPVLCRSCFQQRRPPVPATVVASVAS
jgi:CxxC-x17-CxxC domain-containing protein